MNQKSGFQDSPSAILWKLSVPVFKFKKIHKRAVQNRTALQIEDDGVLCVEIKIIHEITLKNHSSEFFEIVLFNILLIFKTRKKQNRTPQNLHQQLSLDDHHRPFHEDNLNR